jgi:hypothetical protein
MFRRFGCRSAAPQPMHRPVACVTASAIKSVPLRVSACSGVRRIATAISPSLCVPTLIVRAGRSASASSTAPLNSAARPLSVSASCASSLGRLSLRGGSSAGAPPPPSSTAPLSSCAALSAPDSSLAAVWLSRAFQGTSSRCVLTSFFRTSHGVT